MCPLVGQPDAGLLQAEPGACWGRRRRPSGSAMPSTVRPSASVTTTPSPSRFTVCARDRESTCMPRRRKTASSTSAASASSPGSTRSRLLTSTTSAPEGVVGAGELGAGHAGTDDDQPVGQGLEVVQLLPGEDPLAVGQRVGQLARAGRRWRRARSRRRTASPVRDHATAARRAGPRRDDPDALAPPAGAGRRRTAARASARTPAVDTPRSTQTAPSVSLRWSRRPANRTPSSTDRRRAS